MIDVIQTLISQYANSPIIRQLITDWNVDVDPRVNLANFMANIWNVFGAGGAATYPITTVTYTATGPVFGRGSAPTGTTIDPSASESYGLDMWGRRVGASRVVSIPSVSAIYFGFSESGDHVYQPFGQAPFWPGGPFLDNITLTNAEYLNLIMTKAMSNISNCSAIDVNKLLVKLFGQRGNCYAIDKGNMEMEYFFAFVLTPTELSILINSGALNRPAGVRTFVSSIDPATCFGFAGSGYQPFGQGTFQSVSTYDVVS